MTGIGTILISGGMLVDGTASPAVRMDVAIEGDSIDDLRPRIESSATFEIDASGCIVCPGFIDIHTHSDLSLLSWPQADNKVRQGVTTEVVGNCGGSAAPALGDSRTLIEDMAKLYDVTVDWVRFDEYLSRMRNARTSVNVASLVGAETVRTAVLGTKNVQPGREDLVLMRDLVVESMEAGAFGLSSGLIYAPGCYASTEELSNLADAAGQHGGIYTSHIRGEGRTLLEAIGEAMQIGREAGVKVQISHHKVVGRRNWGLVKDSLAMIQNARNEGVDVAFDVYPYTASCTNLYAILPPWVQDGGREAILRRLRNDDVRDRMKRDFANADTEWENTIAEDGWEAIEVSGFMIPGNKNLEHKRMSEIGRLRGVDPADAAFDLILEEGFDLVAVFHEISGDDVARVVSHPLAIIASDGEVSPPCSPACGTAAHPRAFGTFPRAIREYALDGGVAPLEEMIRKMTSAPAERMGLADRGRVAVGMKADIVVFDPMEIKDLATFELVNQYPKGISHVIVNGVPTVQNGEHTGERAGEVLRKNVSTS